MNVKDFVYLDVERIRSLLAHATGGLPTERSRQQEHQAGGAAAAKAGLPWLIQGSGSADYRFVRTDQETLSLHDAICEEMVTRLEPMPCPTTSTDWRPEFFKDGLLLIAAGPLRLVDYNASIDALSVFPDLLSAIERVTRLQSNAGQPSTPPRPGQGKHPKPAHATSTIRPAQSRDIADAVQRISAFVGSTYADYIRVRCYPVEGDRSRVLIGDAARAGFRYPLHSLASAYGSEVDAGWSMLALVHHGSDSPSADHDVSTATATSTGGGQTFEDMLELMLSATAQFSGVISRAAAFPSVAITPLAIFREATGK